jgi:primosomal protein N'
MTTRIINNPDKVIQLDKRTYVPASLAWPCPRCGTEQTTDFSDEYLSYPETNQEENATLYCADCDDHVADATIIVRVTLDLVGVQAVGT